MSKRQSIELKGVNHGAVPIPMGSRIGSMVYSSGIAGTDSATSTIPPEVEAQAANMFQNIRVFMEAAGGTPDDIIHMAVFAKDLAYREAINKEWLAMFPDPHSRPARHMQKYELGGGMLIQCEIVAVLG